MNFLLSSDESKSIVVVGAASTTMTPRLLALSCLACASALIAPTARPASRVVAREYTLDDVPIGSALSPVGNYALVKITEGKDATKGGVLLPDQAKEKPSEGSVVAAGPGRSHPDTGTLIAMPVAEGESVLYGKFDGTPVKYCGEDHMLIRDDDVLLAWDTGAMSFDGVRCISDRILVSVTKQEDTTVSGIALAPGAAEQAKTSAGKVVKMGEGRVAANGEVLPNPVSVGEYVKFRDFAGSDVKLDGDDYVICRMSDCLAKWSE